MKLWVESACFTSFITKGAMTLFTIASVFVFAPEYFFATLESLKVSDISWLIHVLELYDWWCFTQWNANAAFAAATFLFSDLSL